MSAAAIRDPLRWARTRARSAAYLRKWVVLGALIGVIAGLGAAVFFLGLELATKFFLGTLAGYTPPSPAGTSESRGGSACA